MREDAAIGLFSFQKYVMYRDLLDHEAQVARHPIVRSLAQGRLLRELTDADPDIPDTADLDDAQQPSEALSILDADASQRQCVEAAKRGRSFVMQGPPGTGKSQTIANVIAEAIGQGKRVLFVSEKAAALDVVFKRLMASGLDEYCLMLHGEHAGRREVVQALDRSLTTSLQARPVMRPDELERLANLRTVLNDSAELLHLPQPMLGGRTLREVHAELAELHDAPSVAGAPDPDAIEGRAVLDDYQSLSEIFQRLSERWHVSPHDYLWRGYDALRFTADDHGRLVAILRDLRRAACELEAPATLVAHEIGRPTPSSTRDAQQLVDLGDLLEQAPALEAHWLDTESQDLAAAANAGEAAYHELAHQLETFREIWPARTVDDFPADAATCLQRARDQVQRRCGWVDQWSGGLSALPEAVLALDEIPGLIAAVRERAAAVAALIGESAAGFTRQRLSNLADLAELTFKAERRPEREWFVRAGLERAERLHADLVDDLTRYRRQRAAILEHYDDSALELDAGTIGERFASRYTSVFSKLSGAYRLDVKAIRAARKDHKLPSTVVEDLKQIAEAREVGARIDLKVERAAHALGSYARGRDTDPEQTAEALAVAREATALSTADVDLQALSDTLVVGSRPNADLAQAADQLRTASQMLVDRLPHVQRFVAAPSELFEGDLDQLQTVVAQLGPVIRELAELIADLNTGAATTVGSIEDAQRRASLISGLHETLKRIRDDSEAWRQIIGSPFAESATSWEAVRTAARWLTRIRDFDDGALSSPIRHQLQNGQRSWPEFVDLGRGCDQMRRAAAQVTALFEGSRALELDSIFEHKALSEIDALCAQLSARADELRDWTEWRAWRERAQRFGWDDFVERLIKAEIADIEVLPAFQRSYWNRRLEILFDEDPDLAEDLRGGAFQRWVDEFRELDRKLVRTGADRLISRRERARTSHVSTPGSEIDLLRREARKHRRHLPVRILLSRIPTVLSELKPCLMMSPLTVSHFLSPDHLFDLVVFDEASQVPPQDAVNCIYRARQLVVAGDSKQLPPTPFFQIAELDELAPEEEEASTQEDMESILDSCEALLPSHSLRWHYRSRSEPLIAFSNRHIYDGSLVTFPSAERRSQHKGVAFVHVPDGIYDRGRTASNRREAQVVARRVMSHLLDGTHRSVGVIAFNTAQANAISEELDLLKVQHPELEQHFRGDRLDAVFVKHLEAVQGDERDIIIFSVGYGRDASGKFTANFGPLNKDGGQRRLNVAVTRARERLELVSSVRSHDFQLSESASAGARMLRDYIAYAEADGQFSGPDVIDEEAPEWPSALEEQVAEAIAELGFEVSPSVGVGSFRIDLAVQAPGDHDRFLMGIECDGESYARTPTARDRERLRHELLDALGWGPIHRIWSLDWVRNRAGEIARLDAALAAAKARAEATSESGERSEAESVAVVLEHDEPRERLDRVVHELSDSGAAVRLPWTEVYERANLGSHSSHYEFHESVNRRVQTDMLIELLAVEAPISIDYAIRRLAEAWGLRRAGHRVVSAGRQAVSQAGRRSAVEVRSEFLWRPGQTLTSVRVPDAGNPDTRREIDEIPPEEIDLAIARLRESSAGLVDEQLIAQVARVLGFDRTGGRIRSVLEKRVIATRRDGKRKGN